MTLEEGARVMTMAGVPLHDRFSERERSTWFYCGQLVSRIMYLAGFQKPESERHLQKVLTLVRVAERERCIRLAREMEEELRRQLQLASGNPLFAEIAPTLDTCAHKVHELQVRIASDVHP